LVPGVFTRRHSCNASFPSADCSSQALCTAIKIIGRCRSPRLRHIPLSQDIILVGASLCGIGSTIVISIAVDSGLGKRRCLLSPADLNEIQIKVFVSTILFVLALSISKCSMLVFLHQLADTALQKIGVTTVGVVVVIWTLAVMAGIVFECEMPRPWEIWTGKCIPMVRSHLSHMQLSSLTKQ
jgi:hypothetical protein